MKSTPTVTKVETISGSTARWTYRQFRCRLTATPDGITVEMKGGNARPGEPGEGFTFHRPCRSLAEAMSIVETLPTSFGPDDCDKLGFERTGWVIYD